MIRRQFQGNDRLGMDFMLLALLGFVAMVVIMLPYIAIPKTKSAPPPQGNLVVEIHWDDKKDVDVDLWLLAQDNHPVSYLESNGKIWNLLRDDLGFRLDESGENMEIAYSRGIPDGEYIINLHLFNVHDKSTPIEVKVVVSLKFSKEKRLRQIFVTTVTLLRVNEEITVVRFTMKDKVLQQSSMNRAPISLRDLRTQKIVFRGRPSSPSDG